MSLIQQTKNMIVNSLVKVCQEKGYNLEDVTRDYADRITYYLVGKKVIMMVEWEGYKIKIYDY